MAATTPGLKHWLIRNFTKTASSQTWITMPYNWSKNKTNAKGMQRSYINHHISWWPILRHGHLQMGLRYRGTTPNNQKMYDFAIVGNDYFTKWDEAIPTFSITQEWRLEVHMEQHNYTIQLFPHFGHREWPIVPR